MKKLKFDTTEYPEGKTHCLLLPYLFRAGVKFAIEASPDLIYVGIKKPEIEAMFRAGYFIHAVPTPIADNTFLIVAVKTADKYNPRVQELKDFRQVPNGYLPFYANSDHAPFGEDRQ